MTIATYWSPATMLRPMAVPTTEAISAPEDVARSTSGWMIRSRNPARSTIAAYESAPRISQIVVSIESMPPREKSWSICGTPLVETKPFAIAWYTALMFVTSGEASPPTNAATTAGCVNHARTPANSAQPKIERNAGTRRSDRITSSTSGSRLTGVMLNSPASVACAAAVSKAVSAGVAVSPRTANSPTAMSIAGPDVQIIAPMCSLTVTPPTIDGTSTVVSESGVSLSPKYAPETTAPAVITGSAPSSGARATNATPSVAAVVHELPIVSPTRPQITTVDR